MSANEGGPAAAKQESSPPPASSPNDTLRQEAEQLAQQKVPAASTPGNPPSGATSVPDPTVPAATEQKPPADPAASKPVETTSPPPVTTPAASTPPPVKNEPPTAKADPSPLSLRKQRLEFLCAAVQHFTHGHAIALGSAADAQAVAAVETGHRDLARRELATLGLSPEWVQLMLNLLAELRNVPMPTKDQLDGWTALAGKVFDLTRQLFSHAKPIDQELNDALHSLGNSLATPQIVGTLALRTHLQGWETLDDSRLHTILDGHQQGELTKLRVNPAQLIPLIEAVVHAFEMLQRRKAQLDQTAQAASK